MPDDTFEIGHIDDNKVTFTKQHGWIILISSLIFITILVGTLKWGWWMAEMGGGFLLMGIIAALISRMSINATSKAMVKGMEEMVVAALVVGFAHGIEVILHDGMILDSIIYYAASTLEQVPNAIGVQGMLGFQTLLNFFIPSGSGQAAVTMPIMAPLADLLQIHRSTAIFAFTCGDGFSNSIIPTSGFLMAMLALAKVPFNKWFKFMLPLFLMLMALSAIFLIASLYVFPYGS